MIKIQCLQTLYIKSKLADSSLAISRLTITSVVDPEPVWKVGSGDSLEKKGKILSASLFISFNRYCKIKNQYFKEFFPVRRVGSCWAFVKNGLKPTFYGRRSRRKNPEQVKNGPAARNTDQHNSTHVVSKDTCKACRQCCRVVSDPDLWNSCGSDSLFKKKFRFS